MPQVSQDQRAREEQFSAAAELAAMPKATLTRRRRILRWGWAATFLLAVGLSAVPGPKQSSQSIKAGLPAGTVLYEFSFSRRVGVPFRTGRIDYSDEGRVNNVSFGGQGFLGNLVVAFAIVVGGSLFLGRRRRED